MSDSPDVLYVADLAKKLGRTEGAIRAAIGRGSDSVPPPFKLGKVWAWMAVDVDRWLDVKAGSSSFPDHGA